MRTAITCGAFGRAAEVDTESANYVLPGCKALLAITEGRETLRYGGGQRPQEMPTPANLNEPL